MLNPVAQAELTSLADRWGFAAVGIVLVIYIVWQNRLMIEKVGPMLERTSVVLERVARMLEDIESRGSK